MHLFYRLVRGKGDAQNRPQHFAKLDDLVDRAADDVYWDGEANTTICA